MKAYLSKISGWRYGKGIFSVIFNFGLMLLIHSILDLIFFQTIKYPILAGIGVSFTALAIIVTEYQKRK